MKSKLVVLLLLTSLGNRDLAAGVGSLGMPDPAAVEGNEDARVQAFRDTVHYLSRRIDLLLALPVEKLERLALELRMRAIVAEAPVEPAPPRSWRPTIRAVTARAPNESCHALRPHL
jgi:hypothetical protein